MTVYLTAEQVLFIHARLTSETGGAHGVRDLGLLLSAVARPQATFDGQDLYPDLFSKAAALLESLISNHAFVDGNKRTAITSAGLFLRVNGYRLTTDNQQLEAFTLQCAQGLILLELMAQKSFIPMKMLKLAGKIFARIFLILLGLSIVLVMLAVIIFSWLDKTNGRLETSGQERKYLLYVPESYNPSIPAPLVISIHGYAEWPAHQMEISGWNTLADRHGFIVVYPSGSDFPRRWIISGQAGTSNDPMVDVQFISDLIDQLGREYNIDQARIYANGLSNGGGMSSVLGCKLSPRIAAIGSVSGAYLFPPKDCNPSRPVPMIAFHGAADPIVPYQGGPSSSFDLPFPVVPDWIKGWAQQNGCLLSPVELPGSGEVSGIRYTGCENNAEVIFYTIQGGGHSWPGGELMPEWIVGHTTRDIDATEVMWEFFSLYSLDH